jgi:transcription elongation GreA/GreB family factor
MVSDSHMDSEIQKAVDSGKITRQAGQVLGSLRPGGFCYHKSWGLGRVESYNFIMGQILIDFGPRKGHAMKLEYAAESLKPIAEDHILARKAADPGVVRKEAADDPCLFVRKLLADLGGAATVDQIGQALEPEVFNSAEFKKWWASAKRALAKDGHVGLPGKKSDPVVLREEALSQADELLASFRQARQIKDQLAALARILKEASALAGHPEEVRSVIAAIEQAAGKNQKLNTPQAVDLILSRDDLCAATGATPGDLTLARIIRDEEARLAEVLDALGASKIRQVLAAFPSIFGDEWPQKATRLLFRAGSKVVPEAAKLLIQNSQVEMLRRELDRAIRDHSIPSEALIWLCKERSGPLGDLLGARLFAAILHTIEREQLHENRKSNRLGDLLYDDRELIGDLLEAAEPDTARDAMRRLMLCPVFEDLIKRSLLARMVRAHPELEAMLGGGDREKEEALIVSWESLVKRKAEYEDLVNKKIPENTRDISVARSYGDLRENFEYKSAKEMQRVLMRRKSEMERDLGRARATGFENPDTSKVSIGTIVDVRSGAGGATTTYTILGAWDSDPANHVISYLTAVGQALLGKAVGETAVLAGEHSTDTVEVAAVKAAPPMPRPEEEIA